jgi:hypothetical protein
VIDRNGVIQRVLFYAQELKTPGKFAAEADFAGSAKPAPVVNGQWLIVEPGNYGAAL